MLLAVVVVDQLLEGFQAGASFPRVVGFGQVGRAYAERHSPLTGGKTIGDVESHPNWRRALLQPALSDGIIQSVGSDVAFHHIRDSQLEHARQYAGGGGRTNESFDLGEVGVPTPVFDHRRAPSGKTSQILRIYPSQVTPESVPLLPTQPRYVESAKHVQRGKRHARRIRASARTLPPCLVVHGILRNQNAIPRGE